MTTETWQSDVEAWHEFYLLVGTGGANLIGLMFVVVSLRPHLIATQRPTAVPAFFTPIVVDFAAVLLIAGLMMAPGLPPIAIAVALGMLGVAGLAYQILNGSHRQWRENKLEVEDWIWFVALPIASYSLLVAAALAIATHTPLALYVVGAATLLLIVIGIRNAWDLVLWLAEHGEAK
jgi:hypothetical protein